MEIYLDETSQLIQVAALDNDHVTMTVRGTCTGVPVNVAIDTQASHCFIDKQFAEKHGLICKHV